MKYIIAISFLLSFVTFSQIDSLKTLTEIEDSLIENEDNIIFGERLEINPIYPGGPNAMRQFIDSSFVYPPKEINNISGMVWVQFWIDTLGAIDSVEVVKGLSPLIDVEAKRVVERFPNFIPGPFAGKKVPVKYSVPLRVKYVKNKTTYHYPPDIPAEFPKGMENLNNYLWNNLDFSKCDLTPAMTNTKVTIGFRVEKNGALSNIHIIKGISSEIDNEVLRIFNLMPKWLPAESKGEPISTDFELPIRIRVG